MPGGGMRKFFADRDADGDGVQRHRADGFDSVFVSCEGNGRGGQQQHLFKYFHNDDVGGAGHDSADHPNEFDGDGGLVCTDQSFVDSVDGQRRRDRIQSGALHGGSVRELCADRYAHGYYV
jgi:hypothetical protein